MPKVNFRSIGREIRRAQKSLRSGRGKAAPAARTELDDLIAKLEGIHAQVEAACPKVMSGLAVAAPAKKTGSAAKAKGKRRTR